MLTTSCGVVVCPAVAQSMVVGAAPFHGTRTTLGLAEIVPPAGWSTPSTVTLATGITCSVFRYKVNRKTRPGWIHVADCPVGLDGAVAISVSAPSSALTQTWAVVMPVVSHLMTVVPVWS